MLKVFMFIIILMLVLMLARTGELLLAFIHPLTMAILFRNVLILKKRKTRGSCRG